MPYNKMTFLKYELIFFDSDETLFGYQKCEEYSIKKTLREFNIIDQDILTQMHIAYKEINKKLWEQYRQKIITKQKLSLERFGLLFKQFNLNIDTIIFSDKYLFNLSEANFLVPYAEEICKELSKTKKIFIITNGISKVHRNRLKNSSINKYISGIVVSEDQEDPSFNKPNAPIFQFALNTIKPSLSKNKILMIGDSLEIDIKGGDDFGVDTCWYNPNKFKNKTNIIPTYEIQNLLELILVESAHPLIKRGLF